MLNWLRNLIGGREKRAIYNPYPSFGLAAASQQQIIVTPESALTFSAVWAAINVISSDIASLPYKVYRRNPRGGKVEVPSHPVAYLLDVEPNPDLTAYHFEQSLIAHALLTGNGYAEIARDGAGNPTGLYLLDPRRTQPKRTASGSLIYALDNNRTLPAENVIHVAGLGYDGVQGYSPITLARQSITLGLSAEAFGASFYGNGATPGGFIKASKSLSAEALKNLKDSFQQQHGGPYNAHRIGLLEEGVEWQQVTIAPEEAQFLATREFSVIEICRWFNISPIRLQDWSKSTFANVEQSAIDHVTVTLRPWIENLECELQRKLFPRDSPYFAKHDLAARLRGDSAARAAYYRELFNVGVLSVNDIRASEDMEPVEGGDRHYVPLNMAPADGLSSAQVEALVAVVNAVTSGSLPSESARGILASAFPALDPSPILDPLASLPGPVEPIALPSPPGPAPEAVASLRAIETVQVEQSPPATAPEAIDALRAVLLDAVGRMVRREAEAVRKAHRKPDRAAALDTFYRRHAAIVREAVEPSINAWNALTGGQVDVNDLVVRLVEESRAQVEGAEDLDALLDEWLASKALQIVGGIDKA